MNTKREIRNLIGYIEMKKYVNMYDYNKLLELYERVNYFDTHTLDSKQTLQETIDYLLETLSIFKIEEIGFLVNTNKEKMPYREIFKYVEDRWGFLDKNIILNILCENDIFTKIGHVNYNIRYYESHK